MKLIAVIALSAAPLLTPVEDPAAEIAATPASLEVQKRDGYVRLIIATPEAIAIDAEIDDGLLKLDYAQPIEGDLSLPVSVAPGVFFAALHPDRTDVLQFRVAPTARLHVSHSENISAFDIVPDTFSGSPPDILSYRALQKKRVERFFSARTPSVKPKPLNSLQIAHNLFHINPISYSSEPQYTDQRDISSKLQNLRAQSASDGFAALEERLIAAIGASAIDTETQSRAELVFFYFAHGLYPEVIREIDEITPSSRRGGLLLIEAAAASHMERWSDVISILGRSEMRYEPAMRAWRGLAEYKRGAYQAAAELFQDDTADVVPFRDFATDYFLARADLAQRRDETSLAQDMLARLHGRMLDDRQRDERRLIEGRLASRKGDQNIARQIFDDLRKRAEAPVSLSAELALLDMDLSSGAVMPEDALRKARDLGLQWRGGAFERDLLLFEAMTAAMNRDIRREIGARRQLVQSYPNSDAANDAISGIRKLLSAIFDDRQISPVDAAEIFYRNVDMAPPGAVGDALIRDAASTLISLDLLDEAAELLRHQVYYRLRGVQRTRVAATLAKVYLSANDPGAALNVLDMTVLTRLPDELEQERQLLRARANVMVGNTEEALDLLNDLSGTQAAVLRGDIYWSTSQYQAAGAVFVEAFNTAGAEELSAETALRGAASLALAGDREALTEFAAEASSQIDDERLARLLETLSNAHKEQALGDFVGAFDQYFHPDAAPGG
ncbi:MAG: hypothetical protein AAGD92_15050 [Pseudomonadota bacterium]